MTALNPAHLSRFGEVRFLSQKRGEISIDRRQIVDPGQIRRCFESGKNCIGDLASRNFFFAVTARNITRPKADVFAVGVSYRPQKNDGVTVFASTDVLGPKNIHEIARLRLREIGEVPSEPELVKQTASSGAAGVPPTPHAFTIVLIANDELIQGRNVELQPFT